MFVYFKIFTLHDKLGINALFKSVENILNDLFIWEEVYISMYAICPCTYIIFLSKHTSH